MFMKEVMKNKHFESFTQAVNDSFLQWMVTNLFLTFTEAIVSVDSAFQKFSSES